MKKFLIFILAILLVAFSGFLIIKGFPFVSSWTKNLTNYFFKTNNTSQSQETFSFAVLGDPHGNYKIYKKIIDKINKLKPSFLINLGDLTKVGAEVEFKEFKEFMKGNCKIPYYLVVGNHDIIQSSNLFSQYFGKKYYSFDFKNCHFTILDDVSEKSAFSKGELNFLENDLKKSDKKLKFVFLHCPPYFPFTSTSSIGFGKGADENLEKFKAIVEKYNVSKIYAGHVHNLLNYYYGSIPITVTGGAGGPIEEISLFGKNSYHFLIVKVENGEYTEKVVEVK